MHHQGHEKERKGIGVLPLKVSYAEMQVFLEDNGDGLVLSKMQLVVLNVSK